MRTHDLYLVSFISFESSLGDNGSLWFWDWTSGHNFQQSQTIVQPGTHLLESFIALELKHQTEAISLSLSLVSGSLDSEAGIYAMTYDLTGSRLITCEADKTIKMWKEDDSATPETHPLHFKPPRDMRRF